MQILSSLPLFPFTSPKNTGSNTIRGRTLLTKACFEIVVRNFDVVLIDWILFIYVP